MNVTLINTEALFSEMCAEWDALLVDSAADQIFLRCEWLKTWWENYHPGQIWAVALRDPDSGRLDGLAPWYTAVEDGLRKINPIGCVDVTDYLDVIARRGYETPVFEALATWLAEHRTEFDVIELCNFPEASPALAYMPGALERHGFAVTVKREDVCPIIVLPETWAGYFELLNKKSRHELRRKLRRAGTQVEWYVVGPEHDLHLEIDRFLTLMAASNLEKEDFLQNSQHRAFFHALIQLLAERDWLQLAFLTVEGQAAAAYLNFIYNNRVLVYNSGHDGAAHGDLSPGIVLLARLIEQAIADGREVFDFLRGNEPYKYDMGGQDTGVYRMTIR